MLHTITEDIKDIKARQKILILGNHDAKGAYNNYFDEIYTGPLIIAEKILLSHEPVYGLPWCLNIHGHDHNNMEPYMTSIELQLYDIQGRLFKLSVRRGISSTEL